MPWVDLQWFFVNVRVRTPEILIGPQYELTGLLSWIPWSAQCEIYSIILSSCQVMKLCWVNRFNIEWWKVIISCIKSTLLTQKTITQTPGFSRGGEGVCLFSYVSITHLQFGALGSCNTICMTNAYSIMPLFLNFILKCQTIEQYCIQPLQQEINIKKKKKALHCLKLSSKF